MSRLPTSTPTLDAAEEAWWREFGELEDRFCWVQPADVQRLLRSGYVERLARSVPPGATVLELGCGTGWLAVLLAEAGMNVTGIDFSDTQIERAQALARSRGATVDFRVATAEQLVEEGRRFDVVVTHAFLHHLATDEVRAVLAAARAALGPEGKLVAFEPVVHSDGRTIRRWDEKLLFRLERIPLALAKRRLRRMNDDEVDLRRRIEGRGRGIAPLGPSPKEVAFVDDELAELLGEQVSVVDRSAAASMTFRVAEHVLLAGISQPRFWRAARRPLLVLARALDRRMITSAEPPGGVWIFELYLGVVRP